MTTKYLIHGATYCGTGLASNEAASAGASGAWNDINVMEGSAPAQGTALAAGDVLQIRSKTGNGADANITRTLAAATSLGSTSATLASPIRYVLDNGTVWSGINGVLTYKRTAAYLLTLRANCIFEAKSADALVFADEYVAANVTQWVSMLQGTVAINCMFDMDNVTYTPNVGPVPVRADGQVNGGSMLIRPTFNMNAKWYDAIVYANDYAHFILVNPIINLSALNSTIPVFRLGNYGARISVYGGAIAGSGTTTGSKLLTNATSSANLQFYGTKIPSTMTLMTADPSGGGGDSRIEGFGIDGGVGAYRTQRWGYLDSRSDGYYPTLNALYPNSASTPWSWKAYPVNVSWTQPMEVPFHKLYTDTAAAKTITLDLLVCDAFTAADKKAAIWMDVSYIEDSTSAPISQTTMALDDTAALTTSTAAWTATTYGAINLLKRKLAITTQSAIKQDTVVTVVLRGVAKSVSANDILFIDADPSFT